MEIDNIYHPMYNTINIPVLIISINSSPMVTVNLSISYICSLNISKCNLKLGPMINCYQQAGKKLLPLILVCPGSNKDRNKQVKIKNGNGKVNKNLSVIQWNMGSKSWDKKITEIEAVILEYKPDLFAITRGQHETVPTGL